VIKANDKKSIDTPKETNPIQEKITDVIGQS
jgi:hypothetical protein